MQKPHEQPTNEPQKKQPPKKRRWIRWLVMLLLSPFVGYILLIQIWSFMPGMLFLFFSHFLDPIHERVIQSIPIWGEAELHRQASSYLRQKYGEEFVVLPFKKRRFEGETRFFYDEVMAYAYLKNDPTVETQLSGSIGGGGWDDGNWFYFQLWEQEMRRRVAAILENDFVLLSLRETKLRQRSYKKLIPDHTPISFDRGRALLGLTGEDFTVEIHVFYFCDSADEACLLPFQSGDAMVRTAEMLAEALSRDVQIEYIYGRVLSHQARQEFPRVFADYLERPNSLRKEKLEPFVWALDSGKYLMGSFAKWEEGAWVGSDSIEK